MAEVGRKRNGGFREIRSESGRSTAASVNGKVLLIAGAFGKRCRVASRTWHPTIRVVLSVVTAGDAPPGGSRCRRGLPMDGASQIDLTSPPSMRSVEPVIQRAPGDTRNAAPLQRVPDISQQSNKPSSSMRNRQQMEMLRLPTTRNPRRDRRSPAPCRRRPERLRGRSGRSTLLGHSALAAGIALLHRLGAHGTTAQH